MSIYDIASLVLLLSAGFELALNMKRDLMMLQQNSYRNERYTRWLNSSNESTTMLRLWSCIAFFVVLVPFSGFIAREIVAIIISLTIGVALIRRKYKKPLVWTKRATRIYITTWVIAAIPSILVGVFSGSIFWGATVLLLLNFISPLVLLLANIVLKPVESHINRKFYNEAKQILEQMPDLKIIGVTGSYGKTSTKHYLYRILQEKFDVAMTPGSFNTTLGVIRTIREYLKPYNEVFIVEMGAKQPGDIKEICDLVHPQIGIVTAVGEQHLESFKSIENIQKTKFELVDSLPADGLAVVNDDFDMSACRKVENVECRRYAVRNTKNAAYKASEISYAPDGTTFTVECEGKKMTFHTKLVGECNVSNLMGAIIVALYLGVEEDKIRYAVDKIEQVEHRLSMKRTPGGITIIDDAFNSNPTGSRMALDVLGSMTTGKRIVVTPGMIELGERQEDLNHKLGLYAASNVDIAIVVGAYNREAIVSGLKDGKLADEKIIIVDTFRDAQTELSKILTKGDVVLYENDLPDTFK